MASPTSEASLKLEIARLKGAIDRHKLETSARPPRSRSNAYINPNYKPVSQNIRSATVTGRSFRPIRQDATTAQTREIVIGGVVFESSGRSLVRKDLPKPVFSGHSTTSRTPPNFSRARTGHLLPNTRVYMPKTSSRGRRGRLINRNMTLNNSRKPYQSKRSTKRYSDKPCPRFTITGTCSRGLTCIYQHDPAKVAICWSFLQGNCPNTAETCNLSHDPTPERTPLCMHFANNGRCTREKCPFPHVRVGTRHGVCRDFAVLGYCAKGLECDKQHVRECPDFAENGSCVIKGCKLPHVIRANRNRNPTTATSDPPNLPSSNMASSASAGTDNHWTSHQVSAEDAELGDEYISLTFHESESSDEDDGLEEDKERYDQSDTE